MPELRQEMSARRFNQHVSEAKRLAKDSPVVVTDRGRPSHVLMSFADYQRLTRGQRSIIDALADRSPEADFDFDPPREKELPARATEIDFDF